jgi:flagellar biosynthesis protein FlhB
MADGGTGEKTEEPTPERLRRLRQEGNVPKSQDVNSAASLLVVFGVLAASIGWMGQQMIDLIRASIIAAENLHTTHQFLVAPLLFEAIKAMFLTTAPVLATAVVIGVVLNIAQVGFMFTTKPITPDFNRLNPINGLKGYFSMKKVVELLKTIVKFTVIAYLSYDSLKDSVRDVAMTIRADLFTGIGIVGSIIWDFTIRIAAVFLVIAAADYFYQRKRYTKDNMMSKYDIKQEYKQSEGDPQQKADRKRLHQELINQPASQAVKSSDVVVKNPEHIAVALKYDKESGGAPIITAKGMNVQAKNILDLARRYSVPVVRNVPLAQALNKFEVGDDIPEELFEAVAEVLTFIYTLAEEQKQKGKKGGKQSPVSDEKKEIKTLSFKKGVRKT